MNSVRVFACALAWLALGAVALQAIPRIEAPQPPTAPVTVADPVVRRAPAAPAHAVAELAGLLFPPPPALGGGSFAAPPPIEPQALIDWLTRAEAAGPDDPRVGPFSRWVAALLARRPMPRPLTVARPQEQDAIADGWQAAAAAARWPHRLLVWPRILWLPGNVEAPLWLAVDDGRGQLAARVSLSASSREQVEGWTRVSLEDRRVVLRPPRRARGLRLWVIGRRGGGVATLGALALVRAEGGSLPLYDASGENRRGLVQLRWEWAGDE